MRERGWLPYAALWLGVVTISWSAILIRQADAPALVIGAGRMVLAGLPMGALALVQHRRAPEATSLTTMWWLLLSGGLLAAHFAFWIASLQQTSVATSVVLVSAQPLYVALAAPLLLGETIDRRVWFAIVIALVGALTMASAHLDDGLGTIGGDFFASLGGVSAAGYIMIGRRVRPSVSWLRYVGVVYPIAGVLLLAMALLAGESFAGYSTKTYIMIALLALGPQLTGHSSINWVLAYLPAVVVSIAILAEPAITTSLATVVLDEWPSALELAGGVLVLIGVYVALRPGREERLAVEITSAD